MPRTVARDDAPAIPVSLSQATYIRSLLEYKDTTTLIEGQNSRPLGPVDMNALTGGRTGTASQLIGWLTRRPAKTAPKREIHEGLWILNRVNSESDAFLVQRTKNDKGWNVKEWVPPVDEDDPDDIGDWAYVGGVATLPSEAHPATKEEALAFTAAFSRCSECGRVLHVLASREAGIGPICSGKLDAR